MPASTNASYVGRLAPPGRPNTTSTPSALRHSMTASTARMRAPPFERIWQPPAGRRVPLRLPALRGHRLGRLELPALRELELGPAARAQRLVDRHDRAAARAAAVRLLAFVAVEHRGEQADEGRDRRDDEPDQERAALDPADDPAGQAERQRDDDEGAAGHRGSYLRVRTAQRTPTIATTTATNQATPATMPMMTLKRNQAATARTRIASTRAPMEGRVSSMPQMVRRGAAGGDSRSDGAGAGQS